MNFLFFKSFFWKIKFSKYIKKFNNNTNTNTNTNTNNKIISDDVFIVTSCTNPSDNKYYKNYNYFYNSNARFVELLKTFESIKYVFSSLFNIGNDIFKSIIMNPYNQLHKYYDYFAGKGISSELELVQSKIPLSSDQVLAIINDDDDAKVGSLLIKYGGDRIIMDPAVLKTTISEIFRGEKSAIKLAQLLNIINIDEETIRYSSEIVFSELETKALNGLNVFIENLQEKHSNLFKTYIDKYGLKSLFELLEEYPDEKDIIQKMNKVLLISESDICNKKVLILLGILFFVMYIFSIKIFSFNDIDKLL
jgi:hypothetical protein